MEELEENAKKYVTSLISKGQDVFFSKDIEKAFVRGPLFAEEYIKKEKYKRNIISNILISVFFVFIIIVVLIRGM